MEQELVSGTIAAVVFENPENGYAVVKLDSDDGGLITVVGALPAPAPRGARGCVAVDKSVIPLGTTMFITSGSYTYGMAHAEDTGVRGAKIDLFMDTYDECIQFGRRNSVAYFLD